jgi:hypothetical protein
MQSSTVFRRLGFSRAAATLSFAKVIKLFFVVTDKEAK